ARYGLGLERLVMFGRDQAWIGLDPSRLDPEVVVAAAKAHPAHLLDAQPAPLGAVERRQVLQVDDPVGQALELEVGLRTGPVVEEQDRASPAGEELLQRQDLAAVAQGIAGQEP